MRASRPNGDDRGVSIPVAPPRATRTTSGRIVAGVARGLADHLHLPVWVVRVAFVVLALTGGVGLVLYATFWAVLPLAPAEGDQGARGIPADRGTDITRLLALAALVIGGALLLAALGVDIIGGAVIPIVVALVGAALVWQQADDDQRAQWSATAARAARRDGGLDGPGGQLAHRRRHRPGAVRARGHPRQPNRPGRRRSRPWPLRCSSSAGSGWSSSRGSTVAGASRGSSVAR